MSRLLALAVWLFGILGSTALAQSRDQKPELLKITDRVYCATGYALGNVIFVITDTSLVVVDTTESPLSAREILRDFRKVSPLPVSHIIYTHNHGDHIRGAKVFKDKDTKIIAQRLLVSELAKYNQQGLYYRTVARVQFGYDVPAGERGVSLSVFRERNPATAENGYVPPDTLFDEEYRFEAGGLQFEIYHTQGETPDHLMVWIPREGVLLPGDLYYASFPMLASPMKPNRPVLEWAQALERMRKFKPAYLVPSHWRPVKGKEEVDATLANYAKAIRFVHDETFERINKGQSLEEIRREVRLPAELAKLPYLAEVYGRVDWAVNGIYRDYTGWYDFKPAHLNPDKSADFQRALLESGGGADGFLKRARQALGEKKYQLALELADVIVSVQPGHTEAHLVCAEALEKLAEASVNGVEINVYRAAAREHRKQGRK